MADSNTGKPANAASTDSPTAPAARAQADGRDAPGNADNKAQTVSDHSKPVADRGPGELVTDATDNDDKPAVAPRTTTEATVVHSDDTVEVHKVGQRFDFIDKTGNAAADSPEAHTPAQRAIVAADGTQPARHETDDEAKESAEAAKDDTVRSR